MLSLHYCHLFQLPNQITDCLLNHLKGEIEIVTTRNWCLPFSHHLSYMCSSDYSINDCRVKTNILIRWYLDPEFKFQEKKTNPSHLSRKKMGVNPGQTFNILHWLHSIYCATFFLSLSSSLSTPQHFIVIFIISLLLIKTNDNKNHINSTKDKCWPNYFFVCFREMFPHSNW